MINHPTSFLFVVNLRVLIHVWILRWARRGVGGCRARRKKTKQKVAVRTKQRLVPDETTHVTTSVLDPVMRERHLNGPSQKIVAHASRPTH